MSLLVFSSQEIY